MNFCRCYARPTSREIDSQSVPSGAPGNCDWPVGYVVGSVFIVAGCVMIMIVLFIFRQTGRLNDEYAERLSRDVSSF